MTALPLVQNEGVMSSPSDEMVIGGQVIADSQEKSTYMSVIMKPKQRKNHRR